MRLRLSALAVVSVFVATVAAQEVISEPCSGTMRRLAAFPQKGCECQTKTFIKQDGGIMCADMAPENSIATCVNIGSKSKCDYKCKDGYKRGEKGGCSKDEPPPIPEPEPEPEPDYPSIAPPCPLPPPATYVSYSSPNGQCGCERTMKLANKRDAAAVECKKPANGKPACRNTGPKSSECTIECDKGFKPSPDEKSCVPAASDSSLSEMECSAEAGKVGYLTADPVLGCVCKTEMTENFCGFPAGDDEDAEQMCSDTTDSSGKREVKCNVKCSDGFVATDKNTCEKVEVEGETVTYAGTAKPRDSESVPCLDKVWALPGKGGCKCTAETPEGAEECLGVSAKEYAICGYEKGAGEPAFCATECVKGAFKKPPSNKGGETLANSSIGTVARIVLAQCREEDTVRRAMNDSRNGRNCVDN
ncbi:hypothetical protein K438DRAFT_2026689 [Mycena galopus ATCC 62051]|nr:hypothetical protein K438DRAFT_2026689 [Mycena galopus ATCC 62051]